MANKKLRRKYFRKCGWCGCRLEQSRMLRTDVSPNGWLCWDCIYDREQPQKYRWEFDEATLILRSEIPYQVRDGVIDLVSKQTSADVASVVRCFECRHYDEPYCMLCKEMIGTSHRSQDMAYRKPNDFCPYGEHKKEGDAK